MERIIGSAKNIKIMYTPLNLTEPLMAVDIGFVCFMLVNASKEVLLKMLSLTCHLL